MRCGALAVRATGRKHGSSRVLRAKLPASPCFWRSCCGTAIVRPENILLRTPDDGPVLHDLCQRWLLFGWQGPEGPGCAPEPAPEEELRAHERSAGRGDCRQPLNRKATGRKRRCAGPQKASATPRGTLSRAGMPIAVISQIGAGVQIVGTIALCAVGDRIIRPSLTVGDGTANNCACGQPAEHRRACSVVPAMVPACDGGSGMPAAILHGLSAAKLTRPASPPRRPPSSARAAAGGDRGTRPRARSWLRDFPRLHPNTPVSVHVRSGDPQRVVCGSFWYRLKCGRIDDPPPDRSF